MYNNNTHAQLSWAVNCRATLRLVLGVLVGHRAALLSHLSVASRGVATVLLFGVEGGGRGERRVWNNKSRAGVEVRKGGEVAGVARPCGVSQSQNAACHTRHFRLANRHNACAGRRQTEPHPQPPLSLLTLAIWSFLLLFWWQVVVAKARGSGSTRRAFGQTTGRWFVLTWQPLNPRHQMHNAFAATNTTQRSSQPQPPAQPHMIKHTCAGRRRCRRRSGAACRPAHRNLRHTSAVGQRLVVRRMEEEGAAGEEGECQHTQREGMRQPGSLERW